MNHTYFRVGCQLQVARFSHLLDRVLCLDLILSKQKALLESKTQIKISLLQGLPKSKWFSQSDDFGR